jgi:ABC-type dipeptide/oligopeptide/nickel transport system permease component
MAAAATVYSVFTWAGMASYGVDALWTDDVPRARALTGRPK